MAVSGGVDSMVLLEVLAARPELDLIVAHFEHGIRLESDNDQRFVAAAAARLGLSYIYERGALGPGASEAVARRARYDFLQRAREQQDARAIITAHHQDDVIETAIINMLRGTARKGLSSLRSREDIVRPFLGFSKREILAYAVGHNIQWHEDSTNADDRYLRNYVRRRIVPRLGEAGRCGLLDMIEHAARLNRQIDAELQIFLQDQPAPNELSRREFIALPHAIARELIATWLRQNDIKNFDRRFVERLVVAAKTWPPGRQFDINARLICGIHKDVLKLTPRSPS